MLRLPLVSFLAALACALCITPVVIRLATRLGLYDEPGGRRIHSRPIPRVGGVAVFIAMCAGLAATLLLRGDALQLLHRHSDMAGAIAFGAFVLFMAGLADDLHSLTPTTKLAAQLSAALMACALGFQIHAVSFGATEIQLGLLAGPVTILWIVGMTNAFNLIDGLDGLAAGIALVALLTMSAVAFAMGNLGTAVAAMALSGALAGFLRYNFNPARIFLGDSGSMFVGFLLAVIGVQSATKSTAAILALAPLCALALPIFDTTLSIARRWLRGIPFSSADARHVHHRLIAMGLSQRTAVLLLYLVAVGISAVGLAIVLAPPEWMFVMSLAGVLLGAFLLVAGLHKLQYHEFRETARFLASGILTSRRAIHDRIYARDLGPIIEHSASLNEVNAILEDNASTFGFLLMEVCRESAPPHHWTTTDGRPVRTWKVAHNVTPKDNHTPDPLVLRIWCDQIAHRPYGAERVAGILAPVIEQWVLERAGGHSTPIILKPLSALKQAQPLTVGP